MNKKQSDRQSRQGKRSGESRRLKSRSERRKNQIEVMNLDQDESLNVGRSSMGTTSTKSGKVLRGGKNLPFSIVTYVFLAIFVFLIIYFIWFQAFRSESVISSSYNSRLDLYAKNVIRGDIKSADGDILAETTVDSDGDESRSYPYDDLYAHAVGYVNNGKGGIESQYNFYLLRSHSFFLTQVINDLRDRKSQGDTIVTTLNSGVQKAAYKALGDRKGAVVVLEPSTGKILGMVSKPDFNPNSLSEKWDDIVNDSSSSVLLNRVTQGLYPPGSTFKILTTMEYVHEHGTYKDFHYNCDGKLEVNGETIHCYGNTSHGEEDLAKAFAKSCNTAYSSIGLDTSVTQTRSLANRMLFNKTLPTKLQNTAKSRYSLENSAGDGLIMQTAIGQGNTMVTPLHMAMIAAAIDNDGQVMEPYMVDHIENDGGYEVKTFKAESYGFIMSSDDAKMLRKLMKGVVKNGTGSKLSGQSYAAAGKTGSAEYNSDGDSHGWFVGYGSKDGYEDIAIAVIVEDGDSGSSSAVPVAKKVFDNYFNQHNN